MPEMLAYHSDPTLKADMLSELAEHHRLDQIVKGTYGQGGNGDFKGCAVGCSIHSLNRKRGTKYEYGDHAAYEKGFGIPRQLAYLEDRVFENLQNGLHLKWPERFMRAISPGADLSLVMPKFMLWLLMDAKDGVIRFAGEHKDVETAIKGVAALYGRLLKGGEVMQSEWESARRNAYASAAYAAASDAYAYAAAAYAAAAADAAARQKHWVKMSDKLIQLLRAA